MRGNLCQTPHIEKHDCTLYFVIQLNLGAFDKKEYYAQSAFLTCLWNNLLFLSSCCISLYNFPRLLDQIFKRSHFWKKKKDCHNLNRCWHNCITLYTV